LEVFDSARYKRADAGFGRIARINNVSLLRLVRALVRLKLV
jgi:hypothetical protein